MLESFRMMQAEAPWFFVVASFLLGACIGSFLNVCIYRIPAGMSLVKPPSTCPGCGKRIKWYDNIPILGWFLLRGKARCCGQRIAFRYPFVELLTALVFMACWLVYPPLPALCGMVFCALMIGAAFTDFDTFLIPDGYSIGGMVIGIALSFAIPGLHGYAGDLFLLDSFRAGITSLSGALIDSALILWIAIIAEKVLQREAMGFGDVKLMGAIGAFCGWEGGVVALFGGSVLGVIWVALVNLWSTLAGGSVSRPEVRVKGEELTVDVSQDPVEQEDDEDEDAPGPGEIPFGPWLALAGVLYFLFLREPVELYFGEIRAVIFG